MVTSVTIFALLLSCLICVISGIGLYKNLSTFAYQNALQSISDMELYVQTAVSASRPITKSEKVINALKSNAYSSEMNNVMTQFQLTTFSVYSVQVYDLYGNYYKTDGTEDLPSLEQLMQNGFFSNFASSDQEQAFWLRKSDLPGIYNNNRYDQSAGMYTYISKIFNKDQTVGFFLMDFHPGRILSSFFNYNSYEGYSGISSYFAVDQTVLTSGINGERNTEVFLPGKNQSIVVKDKKLYVSAPLEAKGAILITVHPLKSFYFDLAIMIAVALSCCALCVAATYFILKFAMKRTLNPLYNLVEKLEKTKN